MNATEKSRVEKAEQNMQKWLGTGQSDLARTDPDLAAMLERLFFGEIVNTGSLTDKQRAMIIMASLTATQTLTALPGSLEESLRLGVTPLEIKETLYQCAPYIGFPRVEAALAIINPLLKQKGVPLPLESQATVNEETRLKDGLAVQSKIFGADHIGAMRANAPEGQKEIMANFLTAFCFGDVYTRKTLDLKMRELITFSAIVSLGGCDPQAKAHAAANISVGNSKQNLVDALAAMLPCIGFPRTLNGLACVNAAVPEKK